MAHARVGRRVAVWGGGALAIGVAVAAVVAWGPWRRVPGTADLAHALRDRGRVLLVGDPDLAALASGTTRIVRPDAAPEVRSALGGTDAAAFGAALDAAHVEGVLVDGRHPPEVGRRASIEARLRAYRHVAGLAGVYLAPSAALYARRAPVALDPPYARALAAVARGILEGKTPPHLDSFPEPLRRIRNVEVMVLLRDGSQARLWRSARGSSIALGLLTATVVARDRWHERQQAMGGPLGPLLPHLAVEVALIVEDGTLGVHGAGFLDRAITKVHGVGYERKGAWRYLLPEQVRSPGARAFQRLLRDNGLGEEQLDGPDLRLYRLVVDQLASSAPPAGSEPGLP